MVPGSQAIIRPGDPDSRELFQKLFFFLVLIESTGQPRAKKYCFKSCIRSNCALRSALWPMVRVISILRRDKTKVFSPQTTHGTGTNSETKFAQFFGQRLARTARPLASRINGRTGRVIFHKRFQPGNQIGIGRASLLAAPFFSDTPWCHILGKLSDIRRSLPNRIRVTTEQPGNTRRTTVSTLTRLDCSIASPILFRQRPVKIHHRNLNLFLICIHRKPPNNNTLGV